MASKKYIGRAQAVAQIDTVQITAYDAATTYILTVGGQTVSTVGTTDADGTATALAAAWNNSTHPYFSGVTASAATDTVTLTADTPGVPFVATSSKTGGTGTIGSVTSSTANAGPNVFSTAANWSDGAAPANGDTLVLADTSVDILWGLNQSSLSSITVLIEKSFTGRLGLPVDKFTTGPSGAENASYDEYRDIYLQIGATEVRIGENFGTGNPVGSGRIKLDLGSTDAQIEVFSTGSSFDSDPAIKVKDNNSGSDVKVYENGSLEMENEDPADAGEVGTITLFGSQSYIACGAGLTVATVEVKKGRALLHNVPSTLKNEDEGHVTMTATSASAITIENRGTLVMAGASLTNATLQG